MRQKENFSGNFSGHSPERTLKIINPGASKPGSAIKDLQSIGNQSYPGSIRKKIKSK